MISEEKLAEWIDAHKAETIRLLGYYDCSESKKHPKKKCDTVDFDGKTYILQEDPEYRLENSEYIYSAYAVEGYSSAAQHTHLVIWKVGRVGRIGRKSSIFNYPQNVCTWDKPDLVKYIGPDTSKGES